MKKVFSSENRMILENVKNILASNGIKTALKNEFASSVIGEVSPIDSWYELWVLDKTQLILAEKLIKEISDPQGEDWQCDNCSEVNGPAFEICWNCQSSHVATD